MKLTTISIANLYKSVELILTSLFKNKEVRSFLLIFGSLLLLWRVSFHIIWNNETLLANYNNFSIHIIHVILFCCKFIFNIIGVSAEVIIQERIIRLPNTLGVSVGEPCIGFDVSALFSGLILALKGSPTKKMWFIPLGIASIFFLNLIRICALAMLVEMNQTIWELNHKLIFSMVIYTFIFLLWKHWINSEFIIPIEVSKQFNLEKK